MMSDFLVHIDKAKREIAAADSLVKVKDLWNKADAMRALGQAAKDLDLINSATEFKLRCERRLGEMLNAMKEAGDIRQGQHGRENVGRPIFSLKEVNIDPHLSARAQRMAAVPEEKFEAAIATVREEEQQITHRAIASLIGEPPGFNHRAQYTGEYEWYTPAEYIEKARTAMGSIDLDPASNKAAQEVVRALTFWSRDDDGLTRQWHGHVWLNPPYSQPDIQLFIDKLLAELESSRVKSAILLTHNSTDTTWFHNAEARADLLCFTRGRIAFVHHLGEKAAPTQGQAFFYYGEDKEGFRREFSDVGFIR